MQEVFEKISDKFGKLVDEAYKSYCIGFNSDDRAEYDAYINAIEIVRQEAEQYNNGWIPCSDRLPEEHKLYDITFKNSAGIHSDSAIYNPYLKRWLWDADETELVENEILAWAEKREPYQPKGE